MLNYIKVDYKNKETLNMFYDFYQNILLSHFDFDNLGSHQNFIQQIKENENYYIFMCVEDNNFKGGVIFKYQMDNTGTILYIASTEKDTEDKLLTFARSYLNNLANQNNYGEANIKINSPKYKTDVIRNKEDLLLKIMVKKLTK